MLKISPLLALANCYGIDGENSSGGWTDFESQTGGWDCFEVYE